MFLEGSDEPAQHFAEFSGLGLPGYLVPKTEVPQFPRCLMDLYRQLSASLENLRLLKPHSGTSDKFDSHYPRTWKFPL